MMGQSMRNPIHRSILSMMVIVPMVFLSSPGVGEDNFRDDFSKAAHDVDIVILGEVHDNPRHHRMQAQIVESLQPEALVFEMIPRKHEVKVNQLRKRGARRSELARVLEWKDSGWPEFAHYAEILEAAPEAQIFGAEQPKEDVRDAMSEGAARVFGPRASRYGLNKPLEEEEQTAREEMQYSAHCEAVPEEMLPGLVEAQRFRDAGLADTTLRARATNSDGLVVVITGNGHANLKRGMPAALRSAVSDVEVLTLGQMESEPDPDARLPYDFYHVSAPPQDRPDPCAAFNQEATSQD